MAKSLQKIGGARANYGKKVVGRNLYHYRLQSCQDINFDSLLSGEIRAHPTINFVLGYGFMYCKDGGHTYMHLKCNS